MKRRAERDGTPETVKAGKIATKWAENLISAIEGATNEQRYLLFALGVIQIGEETAKALARTFGDLHTIRNADALLLLAVPDVGTVVARSIAAFFAQPHNQEVIDNLILAGVRPTMSGVPSAHIASKSNLAFLLKGIKELSSLQGLGEKKYLFGAGKSIFEKTSERFHTVDRLSKATRHELSDIGWSEQASSELLPALMIQQLGLCIRRTVACACCWRPGTCGERALSERKWCSLALLLQ